MFFCPWLYCLYLSFDLYLLLHLYLYLLVWCAQVSASLHTCETVGESSCRTGSIFVFVFVSLIVFVLVFVCVLVFVFCAHRCLPHSTHVRQWGKARLPDRLDKTTPTRVRVKAPNCLCPLSHRQPALVDFADRFLAFFPEPPSPCGSSGSFLYSWKAGGGLDKGSVGGCWEWCASSSL